jgi:1-deoxy-D-xylulose-5-phosphate synthase
MLLESIDHPSDLRNLTADQLETLATEIRDHIVEAVSASGGHLGPNLGVVELTMAVHRVFDSPRDTVVFDTGHQAYVHKLLTGRHDFSHLRQRGGLSGYPRGPSPSTTGSRTATPRPSSPTPTDWPWPRRASWARGAGSSP